MSAANASPRARLERLVPGLGGIAGPLAADVDAQAAAAGAPAGTVLFDDGSPCAGMLVLESGAVRVARSSPGGRELLLYRVLPGETCVLTLGCLLGASKYPARGVAETDVAGVMLPAAVFERLLAGSPAFRAFVFEAFSARLRGVLELASAVAFERLDRRLAAALFGLVERSGRIELGVTHQQLADELGCAREPVSRLLEGFESRGVLELGRGRVRVLDKAALAALAAARD